jgi:hypothetical protein
LISLIALARIALKIMSTILALKNVSPAQGPSPILMGKNALHVQKTLFGMLIVMIAKNAKVIR